MTQKADIGFIGLGVMGQNLVLNMNDHGYSVSVYNRTSAKTDDFINGPAKETKVIASYSIEQLVDSLESPRRIMLMVKAGKAVDAIVNQLIPFLDQSDIIIDGGNSYFKDSMRWSKELEEKGLHFIGCGISGGEEGARLGPSIMPGGSSPAWPYIKDILQNIAAKVADGTPCCDWVGESGAGHFVKMVHNGIEYGDMQLICEAYDLMRSIGLSPSEMSTIFRDWNKGKLDSYLIEITSEILAINDENNVPLVDSILDTAGQKGTGKWTANSAMEEGIPLTLIGEAVFARFLSALKEERATASSILAGPESSFHGERDAFINDIQQALYASKIISYAQGYMLFKTASTSYNWNLNYGGIALMWRGGCIIRAAFLDKIKEAFHDNPDLSNLLLSPYFAEQMKNSQASWRRVVAKATEMGIPLPAMSSALVFYDGFRRERLPANLLQAQRDYFGAHTYERVDKPRGQFFHTDWSGSGGDVTSGSYNA